MNDAVQSENTDVDPGEDFVLPELRTDLQFIDGPDALDGSPSWIIVDQIRNKYFSIGWSAFQLLSRWTTGKASLLIDKVRSESTLEIENTDVKNLTSFLYINSLTLNSPSGSSNDYYEQYLASKPAFIVWLIHNYLFMKIPLVKPTKFLRKTLRYVEPFFSYSTASLIAIIGLIGLYITGRQWDEFTSTFLYFFNPQGLFFYFISLVFIKILHELGHAYTAIRHGCQVPTMGVALIVMLPILYTDTSDTWRIKSAEGRVHVGAAGMVTELYVACIATFCWGFLPDGILKSAAFILATTSWVMSLVINLNCLMRFDGYYILSDLLGIQNLQKRAVEMGKWRLTEFLFGLNIKPPETLSPSMIKKLCIYAASLAVYRLFLFIGIAVLVYYMFFKVLGIILFLTEIVWFIGLPVFKLLQGWWEMRKLIVRKSRFYVTATLFILFICVFVYPWNSSIRVPAILESDNKTQIYSSAPGYIESNFLEKNKVVKENEILITLKSPKLEFEIENTLKEIEILQLQANRIAASVDDLSNVHIIVNQLQETRSKLDGLNEKKNEFVIRAPMDGVIYYVEKSLHVDRWINPSEKLATIVQPNKPIIEGVVTTAELARINKLASAKFIPDNPRIDPVWAYVQDIEESNLKVLDRPALASTYGGKIPAELDEDSELVPDKSVYRVRFAISQVEDLRVEQFIRGVVHIQGEKESYIKRMYKIVASVFIRESGF